MYIGLAKTATAVKLRRSFVVVVEELRRPPAGVGSVACCVVVPARLVVGVWYGVLVVVEAVSLGVGLFVVAPPKGVEAVVALRL